jgi:hypothetical protein
MFESVRVRLVRFSALGHPTGPSVEIDGQEASFSLGCPVL